MRISENLVVFWVVLPLRQLAQCNIYWRWFVL